ncbi:MAG: hypothetical protein H5T85_04695 [Actinobacteria bacterium]|nr:hypothetical protein [Actinomycetota bacterium]
MNFLIKRFLSIPFWWARRERREDRINWIVSEENFEHDFVSSSPERHPAVSVLGLQPAYRLSSVACAPSLLTLLGFLKHLPIVGFVLLSQDRFCF